MSGHKTECLSYAWSRPEAALRSEDDVRQDSSAAIDQRALEMLSCGDVTCVCSDLPS